MDQLPPNYDSQSGGIVAVAVVMMVVSTIAVMLRFWSRAIAASMRFWWDDWAMLATLISSYIFLALNIYWTTIGLGKHSWMIPLSEIAPNARINLIALVFYATTIYLIKLSALLLYTRIFNTNRTFITSLWATGFIITAWWVVTAIVPWSFCRPYRKIIEPMLDGVCHNSEPWFTASAFINAFLDLVVLVLPLPVIWRLQMTLRRKLVVTCLFFVGYCSAFLSFARFIIIEVDPERLSASPTADPSWNLVPLLYLSMLEAPIAIIALCGPAINQLVARAVKYRSLSSLFTSRNLSEPSRTGTGKSSGISGSTSTSSGAGFSKTGTATTTTMTTGSTELFRHDGGFDDGDEETEREQDIPMGRIGVQRDIEVARYKADYQVSPV